MRGAELAYSRRIRGELRMLFRSDVLRSLAAFALAATAMLASAAPVPAQRPGSIPLAGADAAAVTVPSSPEAWGGIRTGQEATLSERVVRYLPVRPG
jgi:hypothetical protein